MSVIKNEKINSLISLLHDPDKTVYEEVSKELIKIGEEVFPYLEKEYNYKDTNSAQKKLIYKEKDNQSLASKRIINIYSEINYSITKKELEKWKNDGSNNLMKGFLILINSSSNFIYKESDFFNKIKNNILLENKKDLTALEKVKLINHIFFSVYGFEVIRQLKDYEMLDCGYTHYTSAYRICTKTFLTVMYASIAQDVGIPIFIKKSYNNIFLFCRKNTGTKNALFYINIFNKGQVLSEKDLFKLFNNKENLNLHTIENNEVISILIKDIINYYEQKEEEEYASKYRELEKIFYI